LNGNVIAEGSTGCQSPLNQEFASNSRGAEDLVIAVCYDLRGFPEAMSFLDILSLSAFVASTQR
jgi:hypothetical protein